MVLEKELQTYRQKLPELLTREGKYVLIHGEEVAETLDSYEDALRAGFQRFGLVPFFVKQIQAVEPAHHLAPEIATCQS
jgi:hypothetical protein